MTGEFAADGFPIESPHAKVCGGQSSARRRLAIVGSHPKGLEGVPWDDPTIEIWIFNESPLRPEKYKRWDASVQIHLEEVYSNPDNWVNPGYWEWAQQPHGKPIWMQEVDPRVPDSVKYPLEEVLRMVPWRYLRSSPAAALALAIYLGYDEIQLYGSELTSNTEYYFQANNYMFWIGFALGRGIDLKLNCWLSEITQPLYGWEGELQIDKSLFELRAKAHEETWKKNKRAQERLQDRLDQAMLKNDYAQSGKLMLEVQEAATATGMAWGALTEAKRYLAKEGLISRQEYERQSAKGAEQGDKARSDRDHCGGVCEYVWNAWRQSGKMAALNQVRQFHKQAVELATNVGEWKGIMEENFLYMGKYDEGITAAGGERARGRQE